MEDTCYLELLVENKTDQPITVHLNDAYVNDTSVPMMSEIPMEIEAGKTSQNSFSFTGYSKDDITSLACKVCVVDENRNTLKETDLALAYDKK